MIILDKNKGWSTSPDELNISFKFWKSLFCKHIFENVQMSYGRGVIADVYNGKICIKCGLVKDEVKIW